MVFSVKFSHLIAALTAIAVHGEMESCTWEGCEASGTAMMAIRRTTSKADIEVKIQQLKSLVDDVKAARSKTANARVVISLVHDVGAANFNMTVKDAENLVLKFDKDKDGELDFNEMNHFLNPGSRRVEEEETDEEAELIATSAEIIQWQSFQCCDSLSARQSVKPLYFKPRIEFNGKHTVFECWWQAFGPFANSDCVHYIYSNAGEGGSGMCRCLERGTQGKFYRSRSNNHIYKNFRIAFN